MKNLQIKNIVIVGTLVALMAATRMHHFGSPLHLPDASLAVFLLAGFLLASPTLFGVLLLEAAVLDYAAITQMGVSDYCVTPAYGFLIPTYAVLWMAGRYSARIDRHNVHSLIPFAGIAFAALSAAFVISNGSFFLFSGRYPSMSIADYAVQVGQYYLPYLSSAVLYLAPAFLLYAIFIHRADAAHSA
ncbi:MAG: hypothetical protein PHH47_12110 [Gallionella sp.]|nr:hypothetical protein [Gallionella sp.]MDD4947095.1 hypothetical protein [Gallionella sp.]MDD5611889.1 hypothetical protein [Gallionella sp.]